MTSPVGAHFWAENGVHTWEFDEWEHGFFNGVEVWDDFFFYALLFQRNTCHHASADFGERYASGFGYERYGTAGAWVYFQYEDHAVLYGKLYVH